MSRKIFLFLAVSFFVFSGFSQTVQNTQSKCAVVFSNTTYPQNKIPSALKDGIKISTALQRNRFKVYYNENVSKDRFFISLKSFAEKHKSGETIVFYYRGYAVQSEGINYLIPIDADILSEPDIPEQGISIGEILEVLQYTEAKEIYVFLDCTETTPWQKLLSVPPGEFASVDIPEEKDITVMIARIPDKTAVSSSVSLFSKYLSEELEKKPANLKTVCENVEKRINRFTEAAKEAW